MHLNRDDYVTIPFFCMKGNTSRACARSGGEVLIWWAHYEFITPLGSTSQRNELIDWFLYLMNKWTFNWPNLNNHNFTTAQTIFKQIKIVWSPECINYPNMKIIYNENAWDLQFMKIWCSEFCMFYSILAIFHVSFGTGVLCVSMIDVPYITQAATPYYEISVIRRLWCILW